MRAIDVASTVVVLVLGIGHTAFTPVFAPGLTPGALWFSGSGLAMLSLGLLNAARVWGRGDAARLRLLCLIGNVLTLLWAVLALWLLRVPKALLAALAVLGVTVACLAPPSRIRETT